MKKNIALMALTGILTLASCGQTDSPATPNTGNTQPGTGTTQPGTGTTQPGTTTPVTQTVTINLTGVTSAPVTIKDASGAVVGGYDNKATTNGATVALPAGTYTVTAGAVSGYNTPSVQTVVVGAGATSVTLNYTKVIATDVTLTSPAGDGNRILTLEQNVNGDKKVITYVRGMVTIVPNANSGADRIEVFLSSTTNDLNAQNRIYDSRGGSTEQLTIDSSKLRQGEVQYVVVRYWTGTSNTTSSTTIVPDNLGPQVPDVIPVSKLGPVLTQRLGNWANGTIKLAFQNLDTLRDNPTGTIVMPAGVERVEWYADPNAMDGVASISGATMVGTSYSTPYEVSVDTAKLTDGDYDIFAVAYDQLGNPSIVNAQNLFVLNIDNTGPALKAGAFTVRDAGIGGVIDEYGNGGRNSLTVVSPTCDANGIGNIDLYTSTDPARFVSGIAKVTANTVGSYVEEGVGLSDVPEERMTINGLPVGDRLFTVGNCQFLDVNGLDANTVTVALDTAAVTDLLGNKGTGSAATTTITVDNQRPSNLRFSKIDTSVSANGQSPLAAAADDSISGLRSNPFMFFARDTNGTAFGGRAVQLASSDRTNYRFFQPTNAQGKLDLFAVAVDNAGNVSSNRNSIAVNRVGPQLVTLNSDNLFVRRQQETGQFLNYGLATDENPVTDADGVNGSYKAGAVHSLELINFARGNAVQFPQTNVQAGNFYQEVLIGNPLNRIGKGTNDLQNDDLNMDGQAMSPLFLVASTESAPFTSVKALEGGLFAYHAATIDKNGWVSEVIRSIRY